MSTIFGRRILLRPLVSSDFAAWREVRRRNVDWLTKWEAQRIQGQPDMVEDRDAFAVRCSARQRERQLGTGFGFGIFVDGDFAGEVWRVGCMGHTARMANVTLLLGALDEVLS